MLDHLEQGSNHVSTSQRDTPIPKKRGFHRFANYCDTRRLALIPFARRGTPKKYPKVETFHYGLRKEMQKMCKSAFENGREWCQCLFLPNSSLMILRWIRSGWSWMDVRSGHPSTVYGREKFGRHRYRPSYGLERTISTRA